MMNQSVAAARISLQTVWFLFVLLAGHPHISCAETNASSLFPKIDGAEERAKEIYNKARTRFELDPENYQLAWQFARAAFDWAEMSKDNRQREQIALEGIAAARRGVVLQPEEVESRYYLAMNLGQLARTKSLGALRLVDEMEREFKKTRELDEIFDFAGSDRNLGLLYLEAPSFSVGDRRKARLHLLRAIELNPDFPENRLNLIEAYLKWGEKTAAKNELGRLEKIWAQARKTLTGKDWETGWADWEKRRKKIRERF